MVKKVWTSKNQKKQRKNGGPLERCKYRNNGMGSGVLFLGTSREGGNASEFGKTGAESRWRVAS